MTQCVIQQTKETLDQILGVQEPRRLHNRK